MVRLLLYMTLIGLVPLLAFPAYAGNGILLTDTSGGSGDITIADVGTDITALTLNIAGTLYVPH